MPDTYWEYFTKSIEIMEIQTFSTFKPVKRTWHPQVTAAQVTGVNTLKACNYLPHFTRWKGVLIMITTFNDYKCHLPFVIFTNSSRSSHSFSLQFWRFIKPPTALCNNQSMKGAVVILCQNQADVTFQMDIDLQISLTEKAGQWDWFEGEAI